MTRVRYINYVGDNRYMIKDEGPTLDTSVGAGTDPGL